MSALSIAVPLPVWTSLNFFQSILIARIHCMAYGLPVVASPKIEQRQQYALQLVELRLALLLYGVVASILKVL